MKNLFVCLYLSLFVSVANATIINDFTDGYAVANWTQSLNGGSINLTGAPSSIILTSSDDNSGNPNDTDFTIAVLGSGLVSFDWSYTTSDFDSSYDPFGWLLNGIFTQVTNNAGPTTQAGSVSFLVALGDTFGFRAHTTDSILGSSVTEISNFSAPTDVTAPNPIGVPEPESMALLGIGLAGFGLSRKRKTR